MSHVLLAVAVACQLNLLSQRTFEITNRKLKIEEDTHFKILRILQDNPDLTQREIAERLSMSVGGLNYCLNALVDKGFVKMSNFQKSKNKFKYVYLLTPQGLAAKLTLTKQFLQRKMDEYEALKIEIDTLKSETLHSRNLTTGPNE